MHGYRSKVYKYTILHLWVFFWPKSVKWKDFCILEDYVPNDVDALNMIYKWMFFWLKSVKWKDFCILEDYAPNDVDALNMIV